jgi:hypothetical protein
MLTLRDMQEALNAVFQSEIDKLRQQLDAYDTFDMNTGERHYPGPWIDTTQRDKQRVKHGIAEYEGMIALVEKELGQGSSRSGDAPLSDGEART